MILGQISQLMVYKFKVKTYLQIFLDVNRAHLNHLTPYRSRVVAALPVPQSITKIGGGPDGPNILNTFQNNYYFVKC